jgi:hypothetical protein
MQTTPASSSHSLLAMKPAQKTKKQKPTKSATRTTFSYINKTKNLKMKKRRKKKSKNLPRKTDLAFLQPSVFCS